MLCRQVVPDKKNAFEQIYIVKSEPSIPTMDPEDVEVKQELKSEDEQDSALPSSVDIPLNVLDIIIKDEPAEFDSNDEINPPHSTRFEHETHRKKSKKGCKKIELKCSIDSKIADIDSGSEINAANRKVKSSTHIPQTDGKSFPEESPVLPNTIKELNCRFCPKSFVTTYSLTRHEKIHDQSKPVKRLSRKQHYCYICEKEHTSKDELQKHLRAHVDRVPYTCQKCENPNQITSTRLLNKHMQQHRQQETAILKCRFCPVRFHSLSGCKQHEKSHVEKDKLEEAEAKADIERKRLNVNILIVDGIKRYECKYCKRSYTLISTLRRHMNSHAGVKAFVCKTCGKSFNHGAFLTLHEKTHRKLAPLKCETCGKEFKEASSLVGHRHIHTGDKPFVCHCGSSFVKRGGLNTHQRKCDIPPDLGSCTCRFCQVPYPTYLEMIQHVQEIHALNMEDTMCRFCPVKFKDAVQLASHELRHELPGSIKCSQCPRIFRNQFYLDLHMEGHKATFMCHVCGKTFLHNVNLRVHRRVHSDKRPHVCEFCSKTFNCATSIRNHKKTHFNPTSRNFIPGLIADNADVEIEYVEEYEELNIIEQIEVEEHVGLDSNNVDFEDDEHLEGDISFSPGEAIDDSHLV